MTEANKEKTKFRRTSKWKNWRNYLKKSRKVDEITLKPLYAGFQCHHLDMSEENYQILKEDRFAVLNRQTHDMVHWLYRYYVKDPEIIKRLESLLIRMKEFNQ